MRLSNIIFLISLILASSCREQINDMSSDLSSLINSEYEFANISLEKGIRTAFLTYLSDDAVIFIPDITNGKNWYSNYPASNNVLNWKPRFSDISISGDLGYTTGPWEFSNGDNPNKPVAFGHYVSVWKKESDGKWKVIIDVGISHESIDSFDLKNITIEDIEHPVRILIDPDLSIENSKSALVKADIDFANVSKSEGFPKAYLTFSSEDVRLYRDEHMPLVGRMEAIEFLEKIENVSTWNSHASEVSSSGDLGYTYGIMEKVKNRPDDLPAERSTYLRIWKVKPNGKWQLVLDITNPLPSSDDKEN